MDIEVLKRMVSYCSDICNAIKRFGASFEALQTDKDYKNSVAMCILQIGELTTHLTDDFKQTYKEMPWQDIKNMRNVAAHHYGKFDTTKLWETITEDIPQLRDYCNEIIQNQN